MQVVEDEEDGRENDLHDGDEEKVGQHLGEEQLGAGRGRHALRVEHLMADFARPGLVERADRGEHGGHAEHAAGDLAGEGAARIEGDGEEHDDEQREEEHGVDGVERAPLDAQILGEMSPEGAGHGLVGTCSVHSRASCGSGFGSLVRSAVSTGSPSAAAARR